MALFQKSIIIEYRNGFCQRYYMKELEYHELLIAKANHRVVSTDPKMYAFLEEDDHSPIEDRMPYDDAVRFRRFVALEVEGWFVVRLIKDAEEVYFYAQLKNDDSDGYFVLRLMELSALLKEHHNLTQKISYNEAIFKLFDSIFFLYDVHSDTIKIFGAERSLLKNGEYPLEDFKNIILQRTPEDQKSKIRDFFTKMQSKTGRFETSIDSDILSLNSNATKTVFKGVSVYNNLIVDYIAGLIQQEYDHSSNTEHARLFDPLTGIANKSDITSFAMSRMAEHPNEETTIAIVDIDFFKNENDRYGHQFGDVVLQTVSQILVDEVGDTGEVGRFGGDEFLIVFTQITSKDDLRARLRGCKNSVNSAFRGKGPTDTTSLTLSIGTATFPKDASNYDDLFRIADYCLYMAKFKGRNRYIMYEKERHAPVNEILSNNLIGSQLSKRADKSPDEMLIDIIYQQKHGLPIPVQTVTDTFASTCNIDSIKIFKGNPKKLVISSGAKASKENDLLDDEKAAFIDKYENELLPDKQSFYIYNQIQRIADEASPFKEWLKEHNILSLIVFKFTDVTGDDCIMLFESLGFRTQWNQLHLKYYHLLVDILSEENL